ncbi:MAG: alkylphosphonate utilization protein [Pseudomonadota bacterium]
MAQWLPPLRLFGAGVLRDGRLETQPITLAAGRIAEGQAPQVDLSGYLVLPGIVDLGGAPLAQQDGASVFPDTYDLDERDKEAAANGVTTAWIAQAWSWEAPEVAPARATEIAATWAQKRETFLTDLRLELRLEIHMPETADDVLNAVEAYGIDKVVFYDAVTPILEGRGDARHAGMKDVFHEASVLRDMVAPMVPRHLCRLAAFFDDLGVIFGSFADPDAETRERFSMIGARLAATPLSRNGAASAGAMEDPVTMPAPDVLRGHAGATRIGARDLLEDGLCSVLVSDGTPAALCAAAFALVDDGWEIGRAWDLISGAPAKIMRLPDRGQLGENDRADVTIVNARTRRVEATISGGALSHLSGQAALRFMAAMPSVRIAAE